MRHGPRQERLVPGRLGRATAPSESSNSGGISPGKPDVRAARPALDSGLILRVCGRVRGFA